MTRVAFIADPHVHNFRHAGGELRVGVNERGKITLACVRAAAALAEQQRCDHFVVLGDVFDTPRPLPQQLVELRGALVEPFGGQIWLIAGNHDRVSSDAGDHGLGPLSIETLRIHVVDQTAVVPLDTDASMALFPFDGQPVSQWLPEQLSRVRSGHRGRLVVAAHFGLFEREQAKDQPWLAGAADAIAVEDALPTLDKYDVSWLFVGNYHTAQRWSATLGPAGSPRRALHQVGTLCPTGWDNPGGAPGLYGGLEILDTLRATVTRHEIPGPRFVVVRNNTEMAEAEIQARQEGNVLYVDWRCAPEELTEAATAARFYTKPGRVHVEARVDKAHATRQAHEAAAATRSVSTLSEAADAWVSKCKLPEGVDREAVRMNTRRLLGL
jgi:hypothetical protein